MIAFLFPGQGSQTPGMGVSWKTCQSWRLVDEASDAVGKNIAYLLLDAKEDELKKTDNAQISTFVLSCLIEAEIKNQLGSALSVEIRAGHSLGEYSALVSANVLSFSDAVQLVAARGKAMLEAATQCPGTMYAIIGMEEKLVRKLCESFTDCVWVANLNSQMQIVVGGTNEGLEQFATRALEEGAKKAVPLAVGGAFHTPLMETVVANYEPFINTATFSSSPNQVVTNVDGLAHSGEHEWRTSCIDQITSPVQWFKTCQTILDLGIRNAVEIGPGKVLTGLMKRNCPSVSMSNISNPDELNEFVQEFK